MENVYLKRLPVNNKQTLGELFYNGLLVAKTLELPWKNNEKKISCIPVGTYKVVRRFTEHHKNHFWLTDVPKRDFILIHPGNYTSDLLGCIAVGKTHTDMNHDGIIDVTESNKTMEKLLKILPLAFNLIIT